MLDAGAKSPLERTAQSSFKQDRIEGLPFPPMGLPGPGTSNRMISSRAHKASIDVTEAAPTDKAARFRARKASMTAGDELYEGATRAQKRGQAAFRGLAQCEQRHTRRAA